MPRPFPCYTWTYQERAGQRLPQLEVQQNRVAAASRSRGKLFQRLDATKKPRPSQAAGASSIPGIPVRAPAVPRSRFPCSNFPSLYQGEPADAGSRAPKRLGDARPGAPAAAKSVLSRSTKEKTNAPSVPGTTRRRPGSSGTPESLPASAGHGFSPPWRRTETAIPRRRPRLRALSSSSSRSRVLRMAQSRLRSAST